jgi:predicted MFS family arabinose efflux permease
VYATLLYYLSQSPKNACTSLGESALYHLTVEAQDDMIYLLGFLMDFSITTALLAFNFRAVDINSTPIELGVLGSAYPACYSICCLLMARRLASLRERTALSLSPLIIAGLIVVALWAKSVWILIVLAGLAGTLASHFWPPLEHFLGKSAPSQDLYKVLGSFNIWWCAGMTLATALCGILYCWSFKVPLCTASLCLLVIAVAVQLFSGWNKRKSSPVPSVPDPFPQSRRRLPQSSFLTYARISVFLTYAALASIFALFPKLGHHLGMSKPLVSRILFFLFFGQLTSFLLLGKTSNWQYNFLPLLGIHALCAIAFVFMFAFEASAIFAATFAILGFSAGLSYFSSLFYTLHQPHRTDAFAGIHESILSGGRVIGPVAAGLIANMSNLKCPHLFFSFVFTVSSLCAIRAIAKTHGR